MKGKYLVALNDTGFGMLADLDVPENCSVVILAYNKGGGLVPVSLCLPHQVYTRKVDELRKEYGNNYHFEVVAIPANSKDYITVFKNIH